MKTTASFLKTIIPTIAIAMHVASAPEVSAANSNDIDHDGRADLIFQNSSGQIAAWFLDGSGNAIDFSSATGAKSRKLIYSGGLGDWRLKGAADCNGDGFDDFVFQNSAGQIVVWFLDGSGNEVDARTGQGRKAGSKLLYAGGLGDWRLRGIGDINGDNIADLVFQNSQGQIAVWLLDGSGNAVHHTSGQGLKSASKFLYSAGLGDWKIKGIRDINGDGINDLIFQNSAGSIAAWFLDGTGDSPDFTTGKGLKPGSKALTSAGLGDWKIKSVEDINGDGIADLVFQNFNGQIAVWFLDGTGNSVDPSSGRGLKSASKFLFSGGLGDWRMKGSDESSLHDLNDDFGDDHGGAGEVELDNSLSRTAAAPSGSKAKVELSGVRASMELAFEVEDAPAGAYAVSVGGVARGTLTVVASGSGTRGKLKFEPSPDEAGELLLNFPASGQPVQISKSGVVYFTGTSPTMP